MAIDFGRGRVELFSSPYIVFVLSWAAIPIADASMALLHLFSQHIAPITRAFQSYGILYIHVLK
jgi:hypothetical protein